jgi:flagellar hook-associated protein 3 FlgL
MRSFALAAVIGIELMDSPISSEVRAAVNASAIQYAGQAVTGIDNERSNLGVSENRVVKANVSHRIADQIMKLHLGRYRGCGWLRGLHPNEALLAQVETSYTLTARIQQLNLMNYL